MSKATKALTASRRQFLVAAQAAAVVGVAPTVGRASDVSPKLTALADRLKEIFAERKRVSSAFDDAHDVAPDSDATQTLGARCDELMDAELRLEGQIMRFPARTLGEILIVARCAWDQMTADPGLPYPVDAFVQYLVPAVLRLDSGTDQSALDEWLDELLAADVVAWPEDFVEV